MTALGVGARLPYLAWPNTTLLSVRAPPSDRGPPP